MPVLVRDRSSNLQPLSAYAGGDSGTYGGAKRVFDYEVVMPDELINRWDSLPAEDQTLLAAKLHHAARTAAINPVRWPIGPPRRHRGRHRAVAGELWVLFQVDESTRAVKVIGFGRVNRSPPL